MIKGAIFDADGVLLNSMEIWSDIGARYLSKRDIVPESDLNKKLFSMSMEQGAAYLKKTYHLQETEEMVLKDIKDMLREFYFDEVLIKPGVKEVLEFLEGKHIKIALATSSPREHVIKALKRNGVLHFFKENIFTTGELGISKHEPDIYYQAAHSIDSNPDETIVVEDSLYALATAADAGFIPIGVYDVYSEQDQSKLKEIAKVYLNDFSEFEHNFKFISK